MDIHVGFGDGDLERRLKRRVEETAQSRAAEVVARVQRVYDALLAHHGGESVEELVPLVEAALFESGLSRDDSARALRYASALSKGDRIVFEPDIQINW